MDCKNTLDYASFQLSPTRTRCEIYAGISNKQEKLASGIIFKPFVFHVQEIKEQYAQGSSCIQLQRPSADGIYQNTITWFTKGTLQRLIMFVKNPDLLERVGAIETEIEQLDDTFKMQTRSSSKDCGAFLTSSNSSFSLGQKRVMAPYVGEAVKQFNSSSDDNGDGFTAQSRKQLLQALEARYLILNREQGSCFTSAEVAGFDNEHLKDLIAFSDAFGALRLKAACIQFMWLQKKKQECGAWTRQMTVVGCGEQAFVGSNSDATSKTIEENEFNVDSEDSLCVSERISSPELLYGHSGTLIADACGDDLSVCRDESRGYKKTSYDINNSELDGILEGCILSPNLPTSQACAQKGISVDIFSPRIQTLNTDHSDTPMYVQGTETCCDSPSGMTVIENELFLPSHCLESSSFCEEDCFWEKTQESDSDSSHRSVRDFVSIFERRCQEQTEVRDLVSKVKIQKINKSILERWNPSVESINVDYHRNRNVMYQEFQTSNLPEEEFHNKSNNSPKLCSETEDLSSCYNVMDNPIHDSMDDDDEYYSDVNYSQSFRNEIWYKKDDNISHQESTVAEDVPVVVNISHQENIEVEDIPVVLSPNKISGEDKKCPDFSGPSEERVRNFLDRYNEKRDLKIRSRYGDKRERNEDCKTVQETRVVKSKTESQTVNPGSVRTSNGLLLKDGHKTNKEISSRNKSTSNIGVKKSSGVTENTSSRMQQTRYPKYQSLIKCEVDKKISGLVKTQKHVLSNGSMPRAQKDKGGAFRKPNSSQSEIKVKETTTNNIRSSIAQIKQSDQSSQVLRQKSVNSSLNTNNSHVSRKRTYLPPAGLSLDKKIKDSPFPNNSNVEPKQPPRSFLKKGSGSKSRPDLGVVNLKNNIDKTATGKKVLTQARNNPQIMKDVQVEKKSVRNVSKRHSGSSNQIMSTNPCKVVINKPDNCVKQTSEMQVNSSLVEQSESISLGTFNEDARSSVSSSLSEMRDNPDSDPKTFHEAGSYKRSTINVPCSFEASHNKTEVKPEIVSSISDRVAGYYDMPPEVVIQVYEPFTEQSLLQDSYQTKRSVTEDATEDKVCDNVCRVLPDVDKIPPPSTPGDPLAMLYGNGFQQKLGTFQTPTIEGPSPNMSSNIDCSGVSDVSRNEFKQPRSKWGTPRYISFAEHTPSSQGKDLKRFLKFGRRSTREYGVEHDGKILVSDIANLTGSPPDMVNCYGMKKQSSVKKASLSGLPFQRSASIHEGRLKGQSVKHSGTPASKVTRAIYSLTMPFRKKSIEAK